MSLLGVCDNGAELLLNTPNRKELLMEGPPQNTKCNVLGRGSYGTVFKGIFSGKQVAVKVVRNVREACVQSIKNESHVLGLAHPNIVHVLQIESTARFGIVIMERFTGRTLEQIIERMQLPLKHRLFILMDILAALNFCHKHHILHMDVKPQNVLVSIRDAEMPLTAATIGYTCKLCDFGSSLSLAEQTDATTTTPTTTTKNQAQGTVRYMSPEALRGSSVSTSSDVYSFGITMWQLQQRRIPYHWIQCNEIVAYQVVKLNLRPDQEAACQHSGGSAVLPPCDCQQQEEPTQLSPCSLEHVKQLLRQHNTEVNDEDSWFLSNGNATAPPQSQSSQPLGQRKPFQDLHANANRNKGHVVRSLQFDGATKTRANISNEMSQWHAIFDSDGEYNVAMERAYADICKRCWQSEVACRPDVDNLRKRFKKMLQKNLLI